MHWTPCGRLVTTDPIVKYSDMSKAQYEYDYYLGRRFIISVHINHVTHHFLQRTKFCKVDIKCLIINSKKSFPCNVNHQYC